MATIDLHALVDRVLDETDLVPSEDITRKVIKLLREDQLRDALYITLLVFVRQRMSFRHNRTGVKAASNPNLPPIKIVGRSAKVSGYRHWAPWLRGRYDSIQQMLGNCTQDNLLTLIKERRTHAADTNAAADRLQKIYNAMIEHDVQRVIDLPADVLKLLGEEWTS